MTMVAAASIPATALFVPRSLTRHVPTSKKPGFSALISISGLKAATAVAASASTAMAARGRSRNCRLRVGDR